MGSAHREFFAEAAALAESAAAFFSRLVGEAVAAHGVCSVALSGGSTPRSMFQVLAGEPLRNAINWPRLEIFWSDERAVPPDDPESNYRMACEALLQHVPIPSHRIHRMPAERTPLDAAAHDYEAEVRRVVAADPTGTPRFDLVMLGMGDDGHTASLFPETQALDERERLVVPNYVPRLDAHRLTFTPRLINAAANVLFLVAGSSKAEALRAVLEGPRQPRRYPAQLVAPAEGTLYWFLDRDAAAKLGAGET